MSITLKEIERDYENLMNIIGNITTIEQLRNLNNKDRFGYINVDNKRYYNTHDYDDNGKRIRKPRYCEGYENINHISNYILYGQYGCLGTIFVDISNGKINDILFDIWDDENCYCLVEQVGIDEVDEDGLEFWLEDMQGFLDYCKEEEEEIRRWF